MSFLFSGHIHTNIDNYYIILHLILLQSYFYLLFIRYFSILFRCGRYFFSFFYSYKFEQFAIILPKY